MAMSKSASIAASDVNHSAESELHRTIPDLFEEWTARTPEAEALIHEGARLTYQELNRKANRLAHYLIDLGAGPGTRVGICLGRCQEMVVSLVAILKAGAAYVPLDPKYPSERLQFMMEDAELALVVTQESVAEKAPSAERMIILERDAQDIVRHPDHNPPAVCFPESPAYILYTSGSTGRPKGVCLCHRNAVRLVNHASYADLTPDHVFLQFVSISFDVAAFEIWGALLNGARLMIFPAITPSAEELGNWLSRHPVTTLFLPSGIFHQMVEADTGRYLCNVRQLIAGGDVLSLRLSRKVLSLYPNCRLINGYGPTENGTFSTCGDIREMPSDAASVPIGKSIANS